MTFALPQWANDFLEERNDQTIGLLAKVTSIPAPSKSEEKRTRFLLDYFRALGEQSGYIDEVGNLIFPLGCTEGCGGITVMAAHVDTVFPDAGEVPVAVTSDGIMHAPGCGDNTSSVVSLTRALELVCRGNLRPRTPVIVLFDVCEEAEGELLGMRSFLEAYKGQIKEVICIDGDYTHTFDRVMNAEAFQVSVKGTGGNAYFDKDFSSALESLFWVAGTLMRSEVASAEKTVHTIGAAHGDSASAWLQYSYSSHSMACIFEMNQNFHQAIDECRREGLEVFVEQTRFASGIQLRANEAIKAKVEAVYASYGLSPVVWEPSCGDILPPLAAGIPAVGIGSAKCGPGHTREEWLDTSFVTTGAKLVSTLLLSHFENRGDAES